MARVLRSLGVDSVEFMRQLGLDEVADADFHTFVPGSRAGRALTEIAVRLGNRALASRVARGMPVGSFGTFDYAVWTGGTLREAIARSSHFNALVTKGVSSGSRNAAVARTCRCMRLTRHDTERSSPIWPLRSTFCAPAKRRKTDCACTR